MQLSRRIHAVEWKNRAAFNRWLTRATDAELEAFGAHYGPPDPALKAELANWTDEQVDAARRGVPLAMVRAMQLGTTSSPPTTTGSVDGAVENDASVVVYKDGRSFRLVVRYENEDSKGAPDAEIYSRLIDSLPGRPSRP